MGVQVIWIQSLPSAKMVAMTRFLKNSLTYFLAIVEGGIFELISFLKVLVQMWNADSLRILTRIAEFNDDNRCHMDTSIISQKKIISHVKWYFSVYSDYL